MYNVPFVNDRNSKSWRLRVKERNNDIGILRTLFLQGFNIYFLNFSYPGFGSAQTTHLCLVGELAGGGSVAMAEDDSEM